MLQVLSLLLIFAFSADGFAYDIYDSEGNLRKKSTNIIDTLPGQGDYTDALHRFDEANIGLLNIASTKRFYGKDLALCNGGKQVQGVLHNGYKAAIRQERSFYLMPGDKVLSVQEEKIQARLRDDDDCAYGAVDAMQAEIGRASTNVGIAKAMFEANYQELYMAAKLIQVRGAQVDYTGCVGKNIKKTDPKERPEGVRKYVQDSVIEYVNRYDGVMAILQKKKDSLTKSKNLLNTRVGARCGPQ